MTLLQVQIDDDLKNVIKQKSKMYRVPVSSLVKIALVKAFLENGEAEEVLPGNVFNADRDNNGKGIKIDDLIAAF